VTTHSPYFVQNVPLANLRLVRFRNGSSEISSLPRQIISELPWTQEVENLTKGRGWTQFKKDLTSGNIATSRSFNEAIATDLAACWRNSENAGEMKMAVERFRHAARVLISPEDESELGFLGRRVRGEIFFARRWVMVEGPSDYLLLKALGESYGYDLDQHGVAVIDFQNSGSAGIYAALAEAFGIPWHMITDGDAPSEKFRKQLLKRGFNGADLAAHFETLPQPNDLEDQLIVDGHEAPLRQIMVDVGISAMATCPVEEFTKCLKKNKTAYMARLARMVIADPTLAAQMPPVFVGFIKNLKASASR